MNPEAFELELRNLLNRHCCENASDTPDFILAAYLVDCLAAWNRASKWREQWRGREAEAVKPPAL